MKKRVKVLKSVENLGIFESFCEKTREIGYAREVALLDFVAMLRWAKDNIIGRCI